jgi:hypothetical protein
MVDIAVIGKGVLVRPSDIPAAGLGLFADRDFDRLALITEYSGEVIDRAEAVRRKAAHGAGHLRSLSMMATVIDGSGPAVAGHGGGAFVNDVGYTPHDRYVTNHPATNAVFWTAHRQPKGFETTRTGLRDAKYIFLKASRAIKRGDEIYVSYGRGYWKE